MTTHNGLESYIAQRLGNHPIAIMSHLVLGYPSLEENRQVITAMVENGVDLMELQIPFSEPCADGQVIAQANQAALEAGFTVEAGMQFIAETVRTHPIPFLIMTYFNIMHAYGVERFIARVAASGVKGLIIPDLPLQEAGTAMELCATHGIEWIQLLTPTSSPERLQQLGAAAQGFCYCVARRGVTGKNTAFNLEVEEFIHRCRAATTTPLAVGFGVKRRADVEFLTGKAEVAVVGTASIELQRTQGVAAVGRFFAELRG